MNIEKITKDTTVQASYIYAMSWKIGYKGIIPQSYLDTLPLEQWADKLGNTRYERYRADYILSDNGKFVATSSICKARNEQYKDWGEIMSIYVLPEEFRKGYKYASDNYLMPHIVFFTAAVSEQLGDINEAIKMYETYYNNFNKEDSIAEAVYKLAILYKEIDIDKSILYAEEIEDKYSDTMYYNDIITNLLNSVQ